MFRFQRSVAPLLIGTFILRTSGAAATIVLGLFLAHLSTHTGMLITSIQVGFLAAVSFATELSLATPMGALSDHFGRRRFLVAGPLVGCIAVVFLPFTPLAYALLFLMGMQILAGLSAAITTPAVLGYLADYTTRQHAYRMRIMSFFELATSGGIAVGVVVGGFAWDRFERFAFILLGLLYLIVAICMALAPKVMQVTEKSNLQAIVKRYWSIVRKPRLFIFVPSWISIFALISIWLGTQLTFVLSKPAHDPHQLLMGSMSGPGGGHRLSLILGAFVLYFGCCLLFWAFFLSHVPRLKLMLTAIGGIFITCMALEGINHWGFGNGWLLAIWIPLLLVGVFTESGFAPAALAYLADISEEVAKDRGLLMGLYSIFLGIGQLFGNSVGGVFARLWGFDGLIYFTALLGLIALTFLLILFKYEQRHAESAPPDESKKHEHRYSRV